MTSITTTTVPGLSDLPASTGATASNPLLTGLGNLALPFTQLGELVSELLELNRQHSDDGVSDANGAPMLAMPLTDFSGDQLALMLAAIDSKVKESQAKTAKEGIESARVRTETQNKAIQEKMQEAIDKQKEADEKEKEQKIWGWVAKVAAVIGAIVAVVTAVAATIASGAIAAPLLALAVVGLVAAVVDLASAINQEVNPGAEAFTLGSLIGDALIEGMDKAGFDGKGRAVLSGFGAALGFMLMQPDMAGQMAEDAAIADGRSADFAADLRMGVMIAAVVVTLVAMIVATVASGGAGSGNMANSTAKTAAQTADAAADVGSAAAKTADTVAKVGKAAEMAAKVTKVAKVVQGTAMVVQGTGQIGAGVVATQVASDVKDADQARADAKKLDAVLLALQAESEEMTKRLKDIIEALQEGMTQFSQMVNAAGDQRANMARNLVRG